MSDPRGWLKGQIRREGADEPLLNGTDKLPGTQERIAEYEATLRKAGRDMASRRAGFVALVPRNTNEMTARLQLAATTPASFRERWALFWINHFTTAAKNQRTTAAVAPYEREAVRPHVFGKFEDMLVSVNTHPGMLLYLDQAESLGPNSLAAKSSKGGLNENLAREILELHSTGTSAYNQADVTEFARAMTGYTVGNSREGEDSGKYYFKAAMHEPGARKVMTLNIPAGGEEQARTVMKFVSTHPATAKRLAHKIAMHFQADEPNPALVARLEQAWTKSGGDLTVVANALIDAPEAWDPTFGKFKTPYEYLVSGYRAAGAKPTNGTREVSRPLTQFGMRPFTTPSPEGWSDEGAEWAAPNAIVKRLTWARTFSGTYAPGDAAPVEIADAVLGARLTPAVRTAIARAETRPDAFSILLMSPEFQRR